MTLNPSQYRPIDRGTHGEEVAVEALAKAGYQIIERNWRADAGEIDIIAQHRGALVAVEVKTRTGTGYGDPLAAVTPHQLRRIQRSLLHYKYAVHPRYALAPLRVDVVGVLLDTHGNARIELLQDVG